MYKYCPDCKKLVRLKQFNKNKNKKSGFSTYCKKHDYLRKKKSEFNKILRQL